MSLSKRSACPPDSASLLILDDVFPSLLSAFRIAEYNAYLTRYPGSLAFSSAAAYPCLGDSRSFTEVTEQFAQFYPELADRVFVLSSKVPRARLRYFMFLHNAMKFMRHDGSETPFVFTLYPGGGFQLEQGSSDATLHHVCASKRLRKIITTQKVTDEYVRKFIDDDKVEFIYGGVFPSAHLTPGQHPRQYYQVDKKTFDVCFVAFKYMPKGIDKGYDVFTSVARALSRTFRDMTFHVVGSFDSTDIEVSDLNDNLRFYGTQQTDFFPEFYARMDLILAPNVPFVLLPGAFDGFPTGACIEAGLSGVPVFATDILKQNIALEDGREVVVISRDVNEICQIIAEYYRDYDRLTQLGERGQKAFQREFGVEMQLEKRFKILDSLLLTS